MEYCATAMYCMEFWVVDFCLFDGVYYEFWDTFIRFIKTYKHTSFKGIVKKKYIFQGALASNDCVCVCIFSSMNLDILDYWLSSETIFNLCSSNY